MSEKLIAKAYVEKSTEDGILEVAIASDGIVDRHGDVIDQDGWDFKNFKKNPAFLWSHNSGMGEARPPIGKVMKLWFEGNGKRKKLMFKPKFDLEDPFAKEIYRKYKDGFLNAFSVGFIPHDMDGNTYTKSELLEISAVPIPANPNAVVQLSKSGMGAMDWKDLLPKKEEKEGEIITDYETWKSDLDETMLEKLISELKREAHEENIETIKVILKEIKEEKKTVKQGDVVQLSEIQDIMRVLNQATSIALKQVKNLKVEKGV